MNLPGKVIENIKSYLPVYQQYLESDEYVEDLEQRKNREVMLNDLLAKDQLREMTELEFGQVMSSLWATQMWGNKSYLVDNLLDDNELEELKGAFENLLWGGGNIQTRYNSFKTTTKGFGTATITEILSFIYPEKCGIWNNQARKALTYLGFKNEITFIKKSQLNGNEYCSFNQYLLEIRSELMNLGVEKLDLLGINYFLFEVSNHPEVVEETESKAAEELVDINKMDDFDHDEAIEKLFAIGVWLGFDAEKEKPIARGAQVDAVWQAKIANLGVVTYVFEVQRKGSVDSLILNLQKAQNNPSVQRLVVVALAEEIEKIKGEIEILPESFRNSVSYLETTELYRASELLSDFSRIIERLNLVQSEFGYKP